MFEPRKSLACVVVVVAVALVSAGCSLHRRGSGRDGADARSMSVAVEPSRQVEMPTPRATRQGNTLRVSGVVQRKGGYDGPVDGHVHVDLLSPDGREVLDQIVLSWTPLAIPAQGSRQSRYQVTYRAAKLPADARVRVAVVADEYEHAFPAPSGGRAGVGGRGRGGAGGLGARIPTAAAVPSGVGTPSVLGAPRTGHARSTPSAPRQRSSSPRTPPGSRGKF
jgi:hypothetical protein